MQGGVAVPVCGRERDRVVLLAAAWVSGDSGGGVYDGDGAAGVSDGEVVCAELHDQLRAPGELYRPLAGSAEDDGDAGWRWAWRSGWAGSDTVGRVGVGARVNEEQHQSDFSYVYFRNVGFWNRLRLLVPRVRSGERKVKSTANWVARNRELAVALIATFFVLIIRLWMGKRVTFCGVPDSCAYLALGESLSRHHGFTINFLYQYQFVGHHLPAHGIEYWRPGVSFLLLLAQPFGGVTLFSSMVIATLAGICLALAAWKIAMDFSGDRSLACASYLVCLVVPQLWNGSLTADSTLFYGAFAAWFLALFTVHFQGYVADVLALLCIAGVDLIRNDSILLLIPLLVVLWMRGRSGQKKGTSVLYAGVIILGYFAARVPMYIVSYGVLGKVFQSQSLHVLYLTDLSDLGRYNQPSTLHTMLAEGVVKLVKLRIATVPFIAYRMVFLEIGFAIVFLFALTLRGRDNEPESLPELAGVVSFALAIF